MCPDYFPVVFPELAQPPTHRQAIINGFVYIHQTLHQANTTLSKRGGRTMAITPRHYLDFINHYVSRGLLLIVVYSHCCDDNPLPSCYLTQFEMIPCHMALSEQLLTDFLCTYMQYCLE